MSTSIIIQPVIRSLVSAKGPSVTGGRRAMTPLFWTYVGLYGKFDLDMSTYLDLGHPICVSKPLCRASVVQAG